MYESYKIVAVTPAGRARYLKTLLPYMLSNRNIIDEWHLWDNVWKDYDREYVGELVKEYPDFIKLISPTNTEALAKDPLLKGSCDQIGHFFQHAIDKDTIYIRFDDDIVFVENHSVANLVHFRIQNPQYFVVYPNIINNVGCTVAMRNMGLGPDFVEEVGKYPLDHSEFYRNGYHPCDQLGWGNGEFAYKYHDWFLKLLDKDHWDHIIFDKYELKNHSYVSINCICWFGKDFAEFGGIVDMKNEEAWINVYQPQKLGKINAICGEAIVAHFAFYPQRDYLDKTDLLERYNKLCQKTLH